MLYSNSNIHTIRFQSSSYVLFCTILIRIFVMQSKGNKIRTLSPYMFNFLIHYFYEKFIKQRSERKGG